MRRIFLIGLFFMVKLFGCGGVPDPYIGTFSIENNFNFMLTKSKNPLFNNALVSSMAYDERKEYYLKIRNKLNLKEWSNYLAISTDEAKKIVYGKKNPVAIKNLKIQRYFVEYKKLIDMRDWNEEDFHNMLKEAKRLNKSAPDGFFRLRTAYFVIKAMHNLKMFDDELKFIDSLDRSVQKDSIVWEWIDSFKAGAIKNKGDLAKASYLFSKIFAIHKSDAYIGYYDFEIKSDEQWSELLKLAKNDEEKTLFHFLRSLKNRYSMMHELKYMLEIDKNSIWTKRLLVMVAQRVQYRIFELKELEKYDGELGEDNKAEKRYIEDFLSLLKEHRYDNFTDFLYAYLTLIHTDKMVEVKLDCKQKNLLEYIYYVNNLKELDEVKLSQKLKNIEKSYKGNNSIISSLRQYTITKIANLYPKNSIKNVFAYYYTKDNINEDLYDFRSEYSNWQNIKKVKKFFDKKDKNYIEKLLVDSPANGYNDNFAKLSHSIYFTRRGRYKEALKIAEALPPCPEDFSDVYDWGEKDRQRASRENPFNINMSGDNRSYDYEYFYPQTKFLKTMIKLKEVLRQNPNSDIDNYLYATGLYNISFYGNSPMFYRMYKSCTAMTSGSLETLPEAKRYYQKVLKYSKNKELLAKTYYQLMKIDFVESMLKLEKDEYDFKKFDEFRYGGNDFKGFGEPVVQNSSEYKKHYKELLKYKDTKFYNKIKQCVVFEHFK